MLTVDESWVNVQQKTFTKWFGYPCCDPSSPSMPAFFFLKPPVFWSLSVLESPFLSVEFKTADAHVFCRLNNKLKVRDIVLNNLVQELSNGVSCPPHPDLEILVTDKDRLLRLPLSISSRSSAETRLVDMPPTRSFVYKSSKMSTKVSTLSRGAESK